MNNNKIQVMRKFSSSDQENVFKIYNELELDSEKSSVISNQISKIPISNQINSENVVKNR